MVADGVARRVGAEWVAALRSFVRKPAAVFFTFVFPLILIGIFGAVIQTGTGGGGLFSQPQGYYVPGYLAVVVVLTPLSRIGTTVARHRSNNRFDKLSTTPLRPSEWLAAHVLVNAVLIGVASILILGFILVTGAEFYPSPLVALFVGLGVVTFCGIGAVLGRVTSSEDGVIAASNAVGIPVLFLSETFVTPEMLPEFFETAVALLPLTYFSRGVRAATFTRQDPTFELVVLTGVALVCFVAGVYSVPWKE